MKRPAMRLVGGGFALLILASLWPQPALAWGGQGHRIVARLAMRQIRRQASTDADARRVRKIVYQAIAVDANATLESASIFPDMVRRTPPYAFADNWHFVSIPRADSEYDAAVHCAVKPTAPEGDCVVGGLAHFRTVLLEQQGAPTKETLDALSFIIHFVGDMHQPLHTSEDLGFIHDGTPGDRGGNFRPVCFLRVSEGGCTQVFNGERSSKNLHSVWDKLMIIQTGKSEDDYVDELDQRILDLPAETLAGYLEGGPPEWAEETHGLAAAAAYTSPLLRDTTVTHDPEFDDFFFVDAAYQDANIDRVEEQIVKASVRLAGYLKQIAHELP